MGSTLLAFNASLFLEPFIPAVSSGLVHLSPPIPHTASRCLSLSKRCIQSLATGYKLLEGCFLRFGTRTRTCASFGAKLPAGCTALDDEDYMFSLLFACVGGNVWCPWSWEQVPEPRENGTAHGRLPRWKSSFRCFTRLSFAIPAILLAVARA